MIQRLKRIQLSRRRERRVAVDREPDYIDWLHERKCVVCVKLTHLALLARSLPKPIPCWSDAAHTSHNGLGSKGPDSGCVPLCRDHHQEQHRIGMNDFQTRYGVDLKREADIHFAAYKIEMENRCA